MFKLMYCLLLYVMCSVYLWTKGKALSHKALQLKYKAIVIMDIMQKGEKTKNKQQQQKNNL